MSPVMQMRSGLTETAFAAMSRILSADVSGPIWMSVSWTILSLWITYSCSFTLFNNIIDFIVKKRDSPSQSIPDRGLVSEENVVI